jgi:hypothetical protein
MSAVMDNGGDEHTKADARAFFFDFLTPFLGKEHVRR